jgi:hypothetical protein
MDIVNQHSNRIRRFVLLASFLFLACNGFGQSKVDFGVGYINSINYLAGSKTNYSIGLGLETTLYELKTKDYPFVFSGRIETSTNALLDPMSLDLSLGFRMYRGFNFSNIYLSLYPVYSVALAPILAGSKSTFSDFLTVAYGIGYGFEIGQGMYCDLGATLPIYLVPSFVPWILPDCKILIGIRI